MSLNQRQWDILCGLQGSDKPLTSTTIAQMVSSSNKRANTKSFREMVTRDLREMKKITGAIETKKILVETEEGHAYRENAYNWKKGGTGFMANSLTTAQAVALGVLQKVGADLVPKLLLEELKPLFTAVHKNELNKSREDKDLSKKVKDRVALAAEEKWLSKIAILSETVGFVAPRVDDVVEKKVHEALYKENLIEIEYRDQFFVVKPLALVQRGVRRYLIGIKRGHGTAPAYFTISRIKSVKDIHVINYHEIKGGENFDLDAFLKKGLAYPVFDEQYSGKPMNITLWVDEGTFGWINETPLDASQKSKKVKDGYVLSLTTTLREELVFWILSMASHVKVIGPKVLKDRIVADLNAAAKMYE